MDKLTLDTNVWRDWAWCEGVTSEKRYGNDANQKNVLHQNFAKLKSLHSQNLCEIANPLQIYLDFKKSGWKLPSVLENFISQNSDKNLPVVFSYPLAFPVVFGNKEKYEELFSHIFPDSNRGDKKYESNHRDTMLLYAHIIAQQEIYITSDKAILKCEQELQNDWGTRAMNLSGYIDSHK